MVGVPGTEGQRVPADAGGAVNSVGPPLYAVKIESNIPLPADRRSPKYPWRQMRIGDSFFVEGVRNFNPGHASTRTGYRFTVHRVKGGCRVWRIA